MSRDPSVRDTARARALTLAQQLTNYPHHARKAGAAYTNGEMRITWADVAVQRRFCRQHLAAAGPSGVLPMSMGGGLDWPRFKSAVSRAWCYIA